MNPLQSIAHNVATQDNLATAHPIFTVQQKGRFGQWEFITACFTRKGCEDYIEANGHNLKSPRIYVESGHRNREWQAIRAYLLGMAHKESEASE